MVRGLPFSTYAPRGEGVLLYICIAYYMQKGGEGVQIACKIAYVLNGGPLMLLCLYIILGSQSICLSINDC